MNVTTRNFLPSRFAFFFFPVFCLSVIVLVAACGRRGDPVLIIPPDERSLERGAGKDYSDSPLETGETAAEITKTVPLKPPGGLNAIFTQTAIVLSWDEMTGKDIRYYKVYRSSGDGYKSIGKTVTPAFTDKNIKMDTNYHYRVSALGETESPLSEPIKIQTIVP